MKDSDRWRKFANELAHMSNEGYGGYEYNLSYTRMWSAVIAEAGLDHDVEFFESPEFEYVCFLLKLRDDDVYSMVLEMWRLLKNE